MDRNEEETNLRTNTIAKRPMPVDPYPSPFAFIYVFNLIVGAGALAMPLAFSHAGLVLGTALIAILCFVSFITVTYVIEAMAAANAWSLSIERKEKSRNVQGQRQITDHSLTVSQTDEDFSEDLPLILDQDMPSKSFEIVKKFEMAQMAEMFFNKYLAIYAVAVPKSMRTVICPHFKGRRTEMVNSSDVDDDCDKIGYDNETNLTGCVVGNNHCMGSLSPESTYYIFLCVFCLLLCPWTFFNVQRTKLLQLITAITRNIAATLLTSKQNQLTITDKGVQVVIILSKRVSKVNIQTRLRVDENAWPPEPPKTFTPLVLIQHQGYRNLKQSTAMAKFVERGHIDKLVTSDNVVPTPHPKLGSYELLQEVLNTSKVTKEVEEILAPLAISNDPQFILIEGAPGIGKSLLLKQIAYLWVKKQILQKFKLVLLLCLRDPAIQQEMPLINDLLKLFCKRDQKATEIVSACSEYFLNNDGEDLALLFDGYDEYLESLRKDSLIADILRRDVLPACALIVSSRPHASVTLSEQATVRVDILGFTEAEREHYITESMKGQPQKFDELTQYLQGHSTISSLCFIPFNLVVLVYLYKQGIPLPQNSAQLYSYFICLTICRHLNKYGHPLQGNITELTELPKLTDLPEPYNKIIQQLSKLSLEALNDDKLIFTLDEIKAACPDITAIPGAIKGFGLLQAVEHLGLTGTTMTFNFLHFSIQEYLAAHHIANLPADEELRIIQDKFWSEIHFNMFSIYISLTKGQRPSFKHYLCGGNKAIAISDKFLNNQLQCLHLYHCFHEAGDDDICKTIEQSVKFADKKINLSCTTLTASDVESVAVFLASSFHKEWEELYLYRCYIQDHGLRILHRGLLHCNDVSIAILRMYYNGLTAQSSSLISDITVRCKVKKLRIDGNYTIGEDEQLYSMLTNPSTMLETLIMDYTKLSSRGAITLFNTLKDNNKLKMLSIAYNNVTDDASDAITTTLENNSCLVGLYMEHNPLTSEAIANIVNSLNGNNTLELLGLPTCPEGIKKRVNSLQEIVNKKRESQGCQVKLRIIYFDF